MPMNLPPAGGLPSPLTQSPANVGPVSMPQGNAGNIQAALVKVKSAMSMLEAALPLIPMGSDAHSDILDALKKFGKHMKSVGENPQLQTASLQSEAQNVAKQAPMANMARLFSAQQGSGQAPATPQPKAA